MNHNYIRPGGVAADLPDGWRDAVLRVPRPRCPPRLDEYDMLMTGQPIWRERLQGVGVITAEEAIALGATGPILRSTGVAVGPAPRRAVPRTTTRSSSTWSSAATATASTATPSASTRSASRSRIVRQILDAACPTGDYRIQDKKVTPPPRARIDESMEALIHHFKIFTEGFKVPEGEVYAAVESPRGELGCYIVSRRQRPSRTACTSGGRRFVNLQACPHMMRGGLIADAVAVISLGRPDHGRGRPLDGPASPPRTRAVADEIIARYPVPKSALIPLLHLAQEQDGYLTDDAMEHIAELVGVTPAEVLGTGSLLRDVQARAGGRLPGQRLHQHLLPC